MEGGGRPSKGPTQEKKNNIIVLGEFHCENSIFGKHTKKPEFANSTDQNLLKILIVFIRNRLHLRPRRAVLASPF